MLHAATMSHSRLFLCIHDKAYAVNSRANMVFSLDRWNTEGGWLAKPWQWVTSALNLWTSWGGAITIRAGEDWLWGYSEEETRGDDWQIWRYKVTQKDVRCKNERSVKWGAGRNEGGTGEMMTVQFKGVDWTTLSENLCVPALEYTSPGGTGLHLCILVFSVWD